MRRFFQRQGEEDGEGGGAGGEETQERERLTLCDSVEKGHKIEKKENSLLETNLQTLKMR